MCHNRIFEINTLSAEHLKVGNSCYSEPVFYAVVYICGDPANMRKAKSQVDRDGGTNPTWNYGTTFPFDDAMLRNNQLTFNVTLYRKCFVLRDMVVGNFDIPLKELFDKTGDGDSFQVLSYQLKGKHNGTIKFSYRFGEMGMADPKPPDDYPSQVPVQKPGSGGKINLIADLATSFLGRIVGELLSEELPD